MGISVCIVCRNEADRLEACLRSVAWADEVLVMDLESTDDSGDLARRYGARVFSRAPLPIVEPLRNEIAERASGPWILALDPDERVTPGLARALNLAAREEGIDAVVIPRTNIDLGHLPTAPLQRYEPQLRMYRKDRVTWPTFPNRLPIVSAQRLLHIPKRDDLVLLHDRNRTIPEALERAMRYAPEEARAMIDAGQTFSARSMASALVAAIDKQLIRARAWEDGVPGLLRATILVNYKFAVWASFWQLSGRNRTREDDLFARRLGRAVDLPWRGIRKIVSVARAKRRTLRHRSGALSAGRVGNSTERAPDDEYFLDN